MKEEIIKRIDRFISGKDLSMKYANEIGVFLDENYPEDDYMQDIVEILARYNPEGGEYLYTTDSVVAKLQRMKIMLETKNYY